jgi:hypothetical protein
MVLVTEIVRDEVTTIIKEETSIKAYRQRGHSRGGRRESKDGIG